MISLSNVSVVLGRKSIIKDANFNAQAGELTVIVESMLIAEEDHLVFEQSGVDL